MAMMFYVTSAKRDLRLKCCHHRTLIQKQQLFVIWIFAIVVSVELVCCVGSALTYAAAIAMLLLAERTEALESLRLLTAFGFVM